jgi:hypothetical protein
MTGPVLAWKGHVSNDREYVDTGRNRTSGLPPQGKPEMCDDVFPRCEKN